MKILGKTISILLALPIIVLVGGFIVATIYSNWFTYVHHFRLTLEVDTPAGVRSASSVLKAVYVESPKWVPQNTSLSSGLHGDAVFLDLGGGKNVVALLALGANGEQWMGPDLAARALRGEGPEKMLKSFWYRDAPQWTGSADLTGPLMPTCVTFADPAKPETVRVIRPDQFETEFGSGFRFKRVWVEMTRVPISRELKSRMNWVGDYTQETVAWRTIQAGNTVGATGMPDQMFGR